MVGIVTSSSYHPYDIDRTCAVADSADADPDDDAPPVPAPASAGNSRMGSSGICSLDDEYKSCCYSERSTLEIISQ